MGTSAITTFKNFNGEVSATFFRQSDGYPTGHGSELAEILAPMKVASGITGNAVEEMGKTANGMGCLAAQVVAKMKDRVGSIYLCPAGWEVDYQYIVSPSKDVYSLNFDEVASIILEVRSDNRVLFLGDPAKFDGAKAEALDQEEEG